MIVSLDNHKLRVRFLTKSFVEDPEESRTWEETSVLLEFGCQSGLSLLDCNPVLNKVGITISILANALEQVQVLEDHHVLVSFSLTELL